MDTSNLTSNGTDQGRDFVLRCAGRQVDVARAAGVHPSVVHNWFCARRPIPAKHVMRLAHVLHIKPKLIRPDLTAFQLSCLAEEWHNQQEGK